MAQLTIRCPGCHDAGLGELLTAKLTQDGGQRIVCPKGHTLALVVQNTRFDVLAEIACQALLDGYYREAVVSFQASLERFFEFFVFVVADIRGISQEQCELNWRILSKQSERRLGAYSIAYLFHFGEGPKLLPNRMVSFRNRVVHQGYIPNEIEATNFGQAVIDINYVLLRNLSRTNLESVVHANRRDVTTQESFYCDGDINVNAVWQLIYSYNIPGPPTFDLVKELSRRRQMHSLD